jgi:phosphonate transport system permease protein
MRRVSPGDYQWAPPPLVKSRYLRWLLGAAILVYLYISMSTVQVNWVRVVEGLDRAWDFVLGFLRPDFASRAPEITQGILESLAMTVLATLSGVGLGIAVGFGAARNIAHPIIYLACRAFVVVLRSFQEIVIAIVFVVMVGFGPMAGFLTLTLAGIGFIGKLLAEEIENINPEQLEAVRATGATWLQSMVYGVAPQVMPRFLGLALYRFDINFRSSAILGLVGAGGIGATISTAFARYEYDVAAATLYTVVVFVLLIEYFSNFVRGRVN